MFWFVCTTCDCWSGSWHLCLETHCRIYARFVDVARITNTSPLTSDPSDIFCVHTFTPKSFANVCSFRYSIAPCIPLFNRSLHSAGPRCGLCGRRKVLVVVLFLAQSSLASWSLLASHVLRQVFTSSWSNDSRFSRYPTCMYILYTIYYILCFFAFRAILPFDLPNAPVC